MTPKPPDPKPLDPKRAEPTTIDLPKVLTRLREQVQQRREDGAYPPGLEEELEADLRRIITRPTVVSPFADMRGLLEKRGQPPGVNPGRVAGATASGVPGGAVLHSAVARAVSHQTAGVLSQVQDISNALWQDILLLAEAVSAIEERLQDKRALLVIVDALVERVAAYERVPAESGLGVAELTRRIERLEAAEADRRARPWFSTELALDGGAPHGPGASARPANGSPTAAAGSMGDLVQGLEESAPVLALGPAALLDSLRARGVEASGPGADEASERGVLDPLLAVESAVDRSLGALVVAQTLERLPPGQVLDLIRASADKLRPGGRLVVRAANPRSLWGLAHGSAGRPDQSLVDPGWLELCVAEAGYARSELEWGPPAPGGGGGSGEGTEAEAQGALLFGSLYYTIRATR